MAGQSIGKASIGEDFQNHGELSTIQKKHFLGRVSEMVSRKCCHKQSTIFRHLLCTLFFDIVPSVVVGAGAYPPLKQAVKVKLSDKQRILLERLYRGLLPCVVSSSSTSKPISALSPSQHPQHAHDTGLHFFPHELPPLESLFPIRTPADLPGAIGELLLRALESEQRAVQDGISPAASAAVAHAPPAKRAAPNLALVRSNMNLAALQQQPPQQQQSGLEHPAASWSAAHADQTAGAPSTAAASALGGGHRGSLGHTLVEHQIQSPSAFRTHARHHSANDDLGATFRDDDGACFRGTIVCVLRMCVALFRRVGNNHKAFSCFF